MVGKGLNFSVLAELLFYAAFALLPFAFPLAMLLASIMTFGSLGENYELVAMKSSGISLIRIMSPLIIIAFIISLVAFYFANNVLPHTNLRFTTLLWSVKMQKPELIIKEGVFTDGIEGYSMRVGHRDKTTGMLYDILIYDHTDNKANESVTVADSGFLEITEDKKFMVLTLFNGTNNSEEQPVKRTEVETYPHRKDQFGKQILNVKVHDFEFRRRDENFFRNGYRMLNIKQLYLFEDSLNKEYMFIIREYLTGLNINPIVTSRLVNLTLPDSLRRKDEFKSDTLINIDSTFNRLDNWNKREIITAAINNSRNVFQEINNYQGNLYNRKKTINKHEMERHRKFTLSLAVFIFFFIGAPLGAIIRKGGLGMPVVVSILLFILYYIVSMTGEKSAREDVWSMFTGMWFSTLIFLPVGIWLTYKAATDSVVMSTETYSGLIKKVYRYLPLKIHKNTDENPSGNQ
jgi:lipopolysaccharide export system permease protein